MSARAAWNAQNTELAKNLWLGGESGTMIGRKIGMTRAAVIGKMHRLGLADRGTNPKQLEDIATVTLTNPEVFAVPVGSPDPEPVKKAAPKKAEPKPEAKKPEPKAEVGMPEVVDLPRAVPVTPEPMPVEVEEITEAPAPMVEAKAQVPAPQTADVPIILPVTQDPMRASDGGEGKLFLHSSVSKLECSYPLWKDSDNTPIEQKRVCGCRTMPTKSWCPTHYRHVFDMTIRGQKIRVPARV